MIRLKWLAVAAFVLLSCQTAFSEDERCGMLRSAHAAGMASQFSKAQVAAARAWYGRNCNGQWKSPRGKPGTNAIGAGGDCCLQKAIWLREIAEAKKL